MVHDLSEAPLNHSALTLTLALRENNMGIVKARQLPAKIIKFFSEIDEADWEELAFNRIPTRLTLPH